MPKNEEFLKQLFVESQKLMLYRSEVEYKLLNVFILINSAVISVTFGSYGLIVNKYAFLGATLSVLIFVTILTFVIYLKVQREHKIYEKVGQQIVRIWEYFDLFKKGVYLKDASILNEDAKNYGKGRNYLGTISIFVVITIMTDIILMIFIIMKFHFPK